MCKVCERLSIIQMSGFLRQQTIPGNLFLPRNNNSFCWHYPQACQFHYQGWARKSSPRFLRHLLSTCYVITRCWTCPDNKHTRFDIQNEKGEAVYCLAVSAQLAPRLAGLCVAMNKNVPEEQIFKPCYTGYVFLPDTVRRTSTLHLRHQDRGDRIILKQWQIQMGFCK